LALKKQHFVTFYRNPLHYGMDLALIVFGLGLGQLALALSVLALLHINNIVYNLSSCIITLVKHILFLNIFL